MGNNSSYYNKIMDENLKKQQEFIQNIQRIKLEREVQLQHQFHEKETAVEIANNRNYCLWFTTYYSIASTVMITSYRKTGKHYYLIPMLPLTFAALYQWDRAYGNQKRRIKLEAERIIAHEPDLLELPNDRGQGHTTIFNHLFFE